MSPNLGKRVRGVATGPYGPNNPPPPPPGRPPQDSQARLFSEEGSEQPCGKRGRLSKDNRKKAYATRQLQEQERNRDRSRSPARPQERNGPGRYRERSPLHHEQVHERVSAPAQQEQRKPSNGQYGACFICDQYGHEATSCPSKIVKCFACNEWGHTRRECKGPASGIGNEHLVACFRCGELGHVARGCKAETGRPSMSDANMVPVQPKSTTADYGQYEDRAKGARPGPSSRNSYTHREKVSTWDAGDNDWSRDEDFDDRGPDRNLKDNWDQRWRTNADRSGQAAISASRMDYPVEDEVDWDDDALQAGDAAALKKGSVERRSPTQRELQYRKQKGLEHHRQVEIQRQKDKEVSSDWQARFQKSHPLPPKPLQNGQHPYKGPPNQTDRYRPGYDNLPPKVADRYRPDSNSSPPNEADRWPSRREDIQPEASLLNFQDTAPAKAPPTAYDLRGYSQRIAREFKDRSKEERFINPSNGKVPSTLYGSESRHDLGLCFATFLTRKRCEMGLNCPWRHHPLSNAERAWLIEYGKERGKDFIERMDRFWAFPEVPLPGARLQGSSD